MKQSIEAQIKLKSWLLPVLVAVLIVMQLTYPYRGWFILLLGLGGLWLIGYFWARSLARNLKLQREMRFGWAHVGDRLEERFTLINRGFIPALWVEIIDHTSMPDYSTSRVTGVGGSSDSRWYTQGLCTRRGVFTLGPTTMRTGDPFGLYRVSLRQPDFATLTVTPPIVPLPAIEVAPGGRAGEGRSRPDPFEQTVSVAGVRPYVPGDSLHWIHWPTTARQGSLYVRHFESMPSGDWWLFLDLDETVQCGEGSASTEEHAVILAASLADQGLRSGRAVGLVTYGRELTWLPPQSGDSQRHEILRALALVEPGSLSLAELLTRSRPTVSKLSSLVIITASAKQGQWLETLPLLIQQGTVPSVLLLDPASFGGSGNMDGALATLTDLGVAHYVITRDLLDRPDSQAGQQGRWEWRVSATGRAIAVNRPQDTGWKELVGKVKP